MDIFRSFGVDIKLLIASVINFVILLYLLNKILYQPLLDILEKRKNMIKETVENAREVEQKLQETKEREQEILHKAREEASLLLARAEKRAEARQQELLAKAEDQARTLVNQGISRLEQQAEEMKAEIQANMAEIVMLVTKSIMRDHAPESVNEEYVGTLIKQIAKKDHV